jgi:hypothetical protein
MSGPTRPVCTRSFPKVGIGKAVDGAGSLHTKKQQVNARKMRVWQLGIGFRPIDGDGVSVFQMDGADRDHDPQRNG